MSVTKRNRQVKYLSRFNIDSVANLQQWPDSRLEQSVAFVKSEVQRAKAMVTAR